MKSLDDLFSLKGKTVVLTGSAGRIGSRFSTVLASAGANVILVDIERKKNNNLAKSLNKKFDTKVMAINADITNETEIINLKKTIISKFKKVDVLINNAHFVPRVHPLRDAPFEKYPLQLWDEAISKNLRNIFLCSREFGSLMVKQNKGVIINISSIYGMVGADQRIYGKSRLNSPAFYAATKGAVVNLTRFLAAYWHKKNIRVNTLTLGGVYDSNLHKDKSFITNYANRTMIGRMGKNDDFDGSLIFLASDASSYMTGANLIIDGGWTAW